MRTPLKKDWWTERRTAAALSLLAAWALFVEYLPPFRRLHLIWDIDGFHHPLINYAFQRLRAGGFPEWDPAIYCGVSFAGNIQAGLFYPGTWLLFLANWTRSTVSFTSVQILVALHFALALLFAYLWLREREAGRVAAALGALSYAFSGFFLNEVQHLGATEGITWIPFVLWGLTQASRNRSWRPLWKVAAGSALAFLAGFPFIWVVLLVGAMVYAVTLPGRRWLVPGCAAALAFSVLLSMVQILPASEAAAMKVQRLSYGGGAPDLRFLYAMVAPNYFNGSRLLPPGIDQWYFYLGGIALFALAWWVRRGGLRAAAPAFVLAGAALVIMFNPRDLLARALAWFHPANQMVREWNFLALFPAAAALLVAVAIDDFLARGSRKARPVVTWLALAAMGGWMLRQRMMWRAAGAGFLSGWASLAETAAIVAALALGLAAYRSESRRAWKAALLAALVLFVWTDYKVYGTGRRFNAEPGDLDRAYAHTERTGGPERAGFEQKVHDQMRANRLYRYLYNENPTIPDIRYYRLASPQGSDPMFPDAYRREMEGAPADFTADRIFRIDPARPSLFQLLGVRYVVTERNDKFYHALLTMPRFRLMGQEDSFSAVFEYLDAQPVYRWTAGAAICTQWLPETRECTVDSAAGGDFALVENRFPGWRATVDGAPAAIRPYSKAFQQVAVPAGRHTVRFQYHCPGLLWGALVSLGSCAALLGLMLLGRRGRQPARIPRGVAGADAPGPEKARAAMITNRALAWAALTLMSALAAWGLESSRVLSQSTWSPQGLVRLWWLLAVYGAMAAVLWFVRRSWLPAVTAAGLALFAALSVGPLALVAAGLLLLAALAVGDWIVRGEGALDALLALLCGMACYAVVFGVAAHFPVNYPAVWIVAMAGPCLWRRKRFWQLVRPARWQPGAAEYWAGALAGLLLCAQWLVALSPECSSDGLAMHLAAPAYLAEHHLWSFDFRHFVWAVMPMNGDWIYSLAYLVGGEGGAKLANFCALAALCALLYRLCRRWLAPASALLIAAAFLSTPLVLLVTGSLFVENLWAALVLGAAGALVRFRETGERRFAHACSMLLGAALSTKFGALPFVAAIAVFLLVESRRRRTGALGPAGVLAAFAAPPYLYAWATTGNPCFPFLNRIFRSPWFDATAPLADVRFPASSAWTSLWDATFHSSRFLEGQDGSLGLIFLVFAPPALLLALRRESPYLARVAAVVAAASFIGVFSTQAYLRYLYPALPFLALLAAFLVAETKSIPALRFASCALLIGLTALNLYLLPCAGWLHRDFFPLPGEREAYITRHAPERRIIEYLNRTRPGEAVAFLSGDPIAGLRGAAYTASWHTPEFARALLAAENPAQVQALAERHHIRYFISPAPSSGTPLQAVALDVFLRQRTAPELTVGNAMLSRLSAAPAGEDLSIREAAPPRQYDDRDPRIEYTGAWWRGEFPEAWRNSITFADRPGAQIRFRFAGHSVTYRFTKAFNRGVAAVEIDGQPRGEVDLYSEGVRWQSEAAWNDLAQGEHTIVIRVAVRRNPASKGTFVDLDGFVVR